VPLRGGDGAPAGPAANVPLRGQFAGACVEEMARRLREVLPAVMVPSSITLVDALPLTAGNKLDRARLPHPDRLDFGDAASFVAPRAGTEEAVARVWSDVLRLDRIGAADDFFALGGHSLLAMQVMRGLRERFTVDLPLRVIFEHRTVAAIAAVIDGQEEVWI
jgi:acyl carrier protein